MIKTRRLNIYPASNEQMKRMIDEEIIPELKAAYQEMLLGCLAHPNDRVWYTIWNLELNDKSGAIVGNLSFKGIDEDGLVEIGYGTYPEYEGQGFMTEAVTAVVRWVANQPCVHRIEAEAEENNSASIRVLQKAGFIPNGKFGNECPRFMFSSSIYN